MGLTKTDKAKRALGIGASEIGVLAGLSRWSTPIRIFEAKVAGLETEGSLAMELGLELEEPIARIHAKRTGLHLARAATMRHEVHTCALASLDRVAFDHPVDKRRRLDSQAELADAVKNVEIKSTTWRMRHEWGEPGTDQVPDYFLAQAVWQMGVSGLRLTDVVVLFDKDALETYPVPFNENLWLGLLEIAERFWRDHVMTGKPPPVDASDGYKEYLERAFPKVTGVINHVEPGTELEQLAHRHLALKEFGKRLEQHEKLVSNRLREAIGPALGIAGSFGTIKWHRKDPTTKADWEAIARECHQLAAQLVPHAPTSMTAELTEVLRTVEARHQKAKAGYNQLKATWDPEFKTVAANTDTLQLEAINQPQTEGETNE